MLDPPNHVAEKQNFRSISDSRAPPRKANRKRSPRGLGRDSYSRGSATFIRPYLHKALYLGAPIETTR